MKSNEKMLIVRFLITLVTMILLSGLIMALSIEQVMAADSVSYQYYASDSAAVERRIFLLHPFQFWWHGIRGISVGWSKAQKRFEKSKMVIRSSFPRAAHITGSATISAQSRCLHGSENSLHANLISLSHQAVIFLRSFRGISSWSIAADVCWMIRRCSTVWTFAPKQASLSSITASQSQRCRGLFSGVLKYLTDEKTIGEALKRASLFSLYNCGFSSILRNTFSLLLLRKTPSWEEVRIVQGIQAHDRRCYRETVLYQFFYFS